MTLPPDILLDRVRLKSKLRKWQVIAAVLAITALLVISMQITPPSGEDSVEVGKETQDYVARVRIDGMILDDPYRDKILRKLKEDKHAKALILSIDSPGGTTAGGEELYEQIRDISASGKPVVVTMRTLAASGGYMVALAGDHILARKGTITGSIGVLMQSAEFTDLADKVGIKFNTIKSTELKASPSPFEKMTPKAQEAIQSLINDFYVFFVDLVAERRKLDMTKAVELADGRVYTGSQAAANGLVDGIGGEKEALAWLEKNKNISSKLEVKDVSVVEPEKSFKEIFFGDSNEGKILDQITTSGLLAVWHP